MTTKRRETAGEPATVRQDRYEPPAGPILARDGSGRAGPCTNESTERASSVPRSDIPEMTSPVRLTS